MLTGHKITARTWTWLRGGGSGVFLDPPVLDGGSESPYAPSSTSPGLPWHLAASVLAGLEGGQRGNFKLSGQNVKFTQEFTQQEGERPEQAHPMPGSYPSACLHLPPSPSFSALGQNRHKPQGLVAGLS